MQAGPGCIGARGVDSGQIGSFGDVKALTMISISRLALLGALGLLAACGPREPGRVQGAAVTGAATGAGIGLVGGPVGVATGAVIGGGAGAIAGASTSPRRVDLGPPLW